MKEDPAKQDSLHERIERRFKERETARIPFPRSQEAFRSEYPELAAVWEEWFPLVALKLARAISGNLMLIEDAGGWGELTILVERHRVSRVGMRTSSKYHNGRSHEPVEAEDSQP